MLPRRESFETILRPYLRTPRGRYIWAKFALSTLRHAIYLLLSGEDATDLVDSLAYSRARLQEEATPQDWKGDSLRQFMSHYGDFRGLYETRGLSPKDRELALVRQYLAISKSVRHPSTGGSEETP